MTSFIRRIEQVKPDSYENTILKLGKSCIPGIERKDPNNEDVVHPEDKLCDLCKPTKHSPSIIYVLTENCNFLSLSLFKLMHIFST